MSFVSKWIESILNNNYWVFDRSVEAGDENNNENIMNLTHECRKT